MGGRSAARDSDRVVIYFHGSALVTLGLNSHRRFVSKLSQCTGARVLNVAYRLAPQVVIEEAVSDGFDAYRYVISLGFSPDRIVLAGDSAGGLIATNTRAGCPRRRAAGTGRTGADVPADVVGHGGEVPRA